MMSNSGAALQNQRRSDMIAITHVSNRKQTTDLFIVLEYTPVLQVITGNLNTNTNIVARRKYLHLHS